MTRKEIKRLFYEMSGSKDVIFFKENSEEHSSLSIKIYPLKLGVNISFLKESDDCIISALDHEIGHVWCYCELGFKSGVDSKDQELLAEFWALCKLIKEDNSDRMLVALGDYLYGWGDPDWNTKYNVKPHQYAYKLAVRYGILPYKWKKINEISMMVKNRRPLKLNKKLMFILKSFDLTVAEFKNFINKCSKDLIEGLDEIQ
jgi:hypothetical protein